MMEAVLLIVGLVLGVLAGLYLARTRHQAALAREVDREVERLRTEVTEQTRKRVSSEVRESLGPEVRTELLGKLQPEVKAEAEAQAAKLVEKAEARAQSIVAEAELKARSAVIEAQNQAEAQLKERRAELNKVEERLSTREANLDTRAVKLDEREVEANHKEEDLLKAEKGLAQREASLKEKSVAVDAELERISGMTAEDARNELVERMVAEARSEAARKIRDIEAQAEEEGDKRAKKIISVACQRWAGEYVAERCVSVVNLPSDDMKGRIIGREGRNIRALEAAAGVDVIIDDTPEAVVISGFDPVRREIARLSLLKLIGDGRIHPSRIEEVVQKTEQEIAQVIKEAGEQAAFELGIHGLHPEIIKLIGRLKYRTSYGQNMWSHSIEVGFLCGLMAAELGVNVKLARRAGLLHDMGKALTHEQDGSHAVIGADIARKYGEHEIVRNAIGAHHNDEPQNSVIAHLVIAADALSGARPGARREILETYVKRLEDLERISMGFEGVEKTYAIQAGREIRVMVEHGNVNDEQAFVLSREIARKIENELTYPGQIKVTVIRETRAIDYAR